MTPLFLSCFTVIVGEEGAYSCASNDAGNWTGGKIGSGKLVGTNWGISAAAYPNVDIKNLSQTGAQAIYFPDYWTIQKASASLPAFSCDELPSALALIVFDASVNNGQGNAREWLQQAVGVNPDGEIGAAETLPALARALAAPDGPTALATEFLARRIDFMGGLNTWQAFGLGWSRRLAALPWKAMSLSPTQGS